ncbi:putative Nickel transport complex, NikM subunit, transmembrane [uncultured Desulfatiglans sp.]|uniref:Putative Nickel transport complex, NikM subunit, transmembrane n=1 Tax=Uncultured Desulfatiglans sp. TaxID=1748965 RepID=A0A653A3A1_UNCDX|nr:putative Nickel transport complex, NikM subunit, transmembrane [uncultured Desulfatiglans sp.]
MKIKMLSVFALSCFLLFGGSQALAHNIWINPENHYPKVGETLEIGLGWGHTYPASRVDQEMKPGTLAYMQVLDPDGMKVEPEMISEKRYKLKIEKEGIYLVTAGIKPGVFTMTPRGRQWSDKKGVENAISCTSFSIEAKTIMIAGENDERLGAVTGQELEIIPLSNPKNIKPGDKLNLKVLFRGKAVEGVTVNATFAGYTSQGQSKDVAPHRDPKGHKPSFPVSTVTDSEGKAAVSVTEPGYWMIVVSHRSPYPDKETCDEYMHNMAFTFEVR